MLPDPIRIQKNSAAIPLRFGDGTAALLQVLLV